MTDTAASASTQAPAPPAPRRWLAIGLAIVAAIETLAALYGISSVFLLLDEPMLFLADARWLIQLKLALGPFLASAALVLAMMGRVRVAVMMLAALALLGWIVELSSPIVNIFDVRLEIWSLEMFAQHFIYPLLAIAAIVLARRNERLGLAALLVSLPAIIAIVDFTITAMVYGF